MFIIALFIIIPRDLFSHAFGLTDLRVLLGAFPARRRQIDGRRGRDRDGVLVQIQGWVAIADAGWPEIRPPMAPGQRVLWCLPAGGDCGRARAADVRPTPLKNGGDHSFGGRFGPLRNRPPVFWRHFLDSWRQDGENSEKTEKKRAKMGEIQPSKKSAGRRPICDG